MAFPFIQVGEYMPDMPDFQNPGAITAKNVIATARGYRPLPAFAAYSTTPLGARAQGAYYVHSSDGTAFQFAGDITKLYKLGGTFAWADVSRAAGGAYATEALDKWSFAKFGTNVVAVNGTDNPQRFDVDADVLFSLVAGSPPTGPRYVATIGDFVVFARLLAARMTVQWGPINSLTNSWATSATTQADSQVIPDGGAITGLVGFEYGGFLMQERCIRRMDYEGPPLIFRFRKILDNIGATIDGSVASHGDRVFFCDRSGFYMLTQGSEVVPIGAEKVNRTFWADLDQSNKHRVTSMADPVNACYVVSYPAAGNDGTPNRLLLYHWDTNRWSYAEPGNHEMIYPGVSQTGYTLAGLDAVSATLGGLPFPLGSPVWAGTQTPLMAAFNTSHNIGYFNGDNLEATVDTGEVQLIPPGRAFVRSLRPVVNGGTPTVALITRDRTSDAVTVGMDVAINSAGFCRVRSNARYHRARIKVPAASAWSHLQGVDEIEASPAGNR